MNEVKFSSVSYSKSSAGLHIFFFLKHFKNRTKGGEVSI